jgi:hypothetical protein
MGFNFRNAEFFMHLSIKNFFFYVNLSFVLPELEVVGFDGILAPPVHDDY